MACRIMFKVLELVKIQEILTVRASTLISGQDHEYPFASLGLSCFLYCQKSRQKLAF